MANHIEDLKKELEARIKGHRPGNPFNPTLTHRQAQLSPDETVVIYYVDLPKNERAKYVKTYFNSDRDWVEMRGNDYNLTTFLRNKWQK